MIDRDSIEPSRQTHPPDAPETVRAAVAGHEKNLLLYATRLVGNAERAREIVQESFAKLVVEQQKGGLNGCLVPWLYTVCRNQALDVRRKERRMKLMIDPEQQTDAITTDDDPAHAVEQTDTTSRVLKLLSHLPANQREAIRLKFQGGLSYRQISEVTGLSESNVGFLIHTGLKTLREKLGASDNP